MGGGGAEEEESEEEGVSITKRHTVRITITIDAIANMDDDTLERRLENFIDPTSLSEQLLGTEKVTFLATNIDIKQGSA